MRRRAAKVDDNHGEIVRALRAVGAFVVDLSSVGGSCPDLLVGHRGRWVLIEVKDGKKPPYRARLAAGQWLFHQQAKEMNLPCYVVKSVAGAIGALAPDPEPSPASKPGPFDGTVGAVK